LEAQARFELGIGLVGRLDLLIDGRGGFL